MGKKAVKLLHKELSEGKTKKNISKKPIEERIEVETKEETKNAFVFENTETKDPSDYGGLKIIGDDPWSENFKEKIRKTPHYKLAKMWADGLVPVYLNTEYYQFLINEIKEKGCVFGFIKTEEEAYKQYGKFNKMFDDIKSGVFIDDEIITKAECRGETHYYGFYPVIIHNDGNLVLWDGDHRIAIRMALNLPIKVTICHRFSVWKNMLEKVEELYPNKVLYQPILHPEFSNWQSSRSDEKENILRSILVRYDIKSILDLGCCHGYTLYKIRDLIDWGIGVESEFTRYEISNMICKLIGIACYHDDIYDSVMNLPHTVGAIMSLASMHHLMRRIDIKDFDTFLKKVSEMSNNFIYELPNSEEEQFDWMYPEIRNNIDEYIMEKTGYKFREFHKIGHRQLVHLRRY